MERLLFNEAEPPPALAAHRALQFGDGVFRTMLVYQGEVHDLQGQWAHLLQDARALALDIDEPEAVLQSLRDAAAGVALARLKLILLRAQRPAGADRLLQLEAFKPGDARAWTLGVSPQPLSRSNKFAGIKHLNRLELLRATAAWTESAAVAADEVLLCDDQAQVVCGGRSNVFWGKEGQLCTASLAACGVAGRSRARVLQAAAELAMEVQVRDAPLAELEAADEVFACNSLHGIKPVSSIDRWAFAVPGPMTAALQQSLAHPLNR